MSGILLALLLTQAADAPLAVLQEKPAESVAAGTSLEYDAVCMNEELAVKTAQRIVSAETELEVAKENNFLISKPVMIGGLLGVFVLGAVIGGVAIAATRK